MTSYLFTVELTGEGSTVSEAWESAKLSFLSNPPHYSDDIGYRVIDTPTDQEDEEDMIVYQPKLDNQSRIIGHDVFISPNAVWENKEVLLEEYPECMVVTVQLKKVFSPAFYDR